MLKVIADWLRQEESSDPELAIQTEAMFAANPQLRALSTAHQRLVGATTGLVLEAVGPFSDRLREAPRPGARSTLVMPTLDPWVAGLTISGQNFGAGPATFSLAIANLADNAASSPLTNLYVALHTADPGESGTQSTNEISYTSYARVAVARSSAGWTVTGSRNPACCSLSTPRTTGLACRAT